ncbi:hypothetical protein [Amycolatopsis sp. CA-230715]|uniref:hypothetical protein n=1 Tax=Amycolatopsis sp. CA-230715 TaxID=2745196 RepID=UPI001C00CDBC|nr:hypothetical protein [Amycolatopsis sp. CA-230715]QWF85297.1 hypothetical protein HUW46_08751 [Amycolatopsis sp. CA-230715]
MENAWRTTLITQVRELPSWRTTQLVVGLIETDRGIRTAMRIGEDGQVVLIADQAANEHIKHIKATLAERDRLTGEDGAAP